VSQDMCTHSTVIQMPSAVVGKLLSLLWIINGLINRVLPEKPIGFFMDNFQGFFEKSSGVIQANA
jgi:hypothetical protein